MNEGNPVTYLNIEKGPAEPPSRCPACGVEGGHAKIKWPYPYPFQLVSYMLIRCPVTDIGQDEGDFT